MPDKNFYCSNMSISQSEPLFATASYCAAFLLVRHPCPFPEKIKDAFLPPQWIKRVSDFARRKNAKLILIRETDHIPLPEVIFVDHFNHRYKRMVVAEADFEFFDFAAAISSTELPWEYDPFLLVCTNGKKDKCCSVKGFPLYLHLLEQSPYHVFQCSHVGGDRFAANVLLMPFGIYYGRLVSAETEKLVRSINQREILLNNYRGSAHLNFKKQAVEFFLRRELDYLKIESRFMITGLRHNASLTEASGIFNDHYFELTMDVYEDGYQNFLTCKSATMESNKKYTLLDIHTSRPGH